jgi:anti-sigma B factor antagonist
MIIRTEIGPGISVIHLVGRFDAHEAQGFRRAADPLLSAQNNVLRIDLSQVAFVDSTALAELVRLQKIASSLSGEVILTKPSDPVRVILEITALAAVFTVENALPESP